MEISKKNRRDYDKAAKPRREYGSKPDAKREFGAKKGYSPKKEFEPKKEFGAKKEFESKKEFGAKKEFGPRREFEGRKSYSERPEKFERSERSERSERPGRKEFDGKKSFGAKREFRRGTTVTTRRKAAPEAPSFEVRLNKFIANSGVCSRREADRLIESGAVTVNGKVITELGTKIDTRRDTVLFGDQKLKGEEKVYIIMNKPKGFVTTTSDPHADQTVMDLLTKCPARVFPVGRLDKNTTGVLMFTNDGELSEKLTHPSFEKKKIYEVTLDKNLSEEHFRAILDGITLEDGPIKADQLSYVDATSRRIVGIEIHSGKNRIVRRIFESFGYQVKALDRVYFAGLTKKGIKRGQWRYLTEGEVNILKMGAFN